MSENPAASGPEPAEHVDVKGLIRQASKRVPVSELVQKGMKSISLLSKERIDGLINQAVRNIVNKYRALAAGLSVPREQVELESREEFHELLTQYEVADRAARTVETAAAAVSSNIDEIVREAEDAAQRVAAEDVEKLLAEGFSELEGEIARAAARAIEDRRSLTEGPEAADEVGRVERALDPIIRRIVQRNAELYFADGRRARDREVSLLEQRLAKMRGELGRMEEALKAIAAQKLITNTQMRTLLQSFGILEDDPEAERKREMLKVILAQNIELRKQLRELEGRTGPSGEAA